MGRPEPKIKNDGQLNAARTDCHLPVRMELCTARKISAAVGLHVLVNALQSQFRPVEPRIEDAEFDRLCQRALSQRGVGLEHGGAIRAASSGFHQMNCWPRSSARKTPVALRGFLRTHSLLASMVMNRHSGSYLPVQPRLLKPKASASRLSGIGCMSASILPSLSITWRAGAPPTALILSFAAETPPTWPS